MWFQSQSSIDEELTQESHQEPAKERLEDLQRCRSGQLRIQVALQQRAKPARQRRSREWNCTIGQFGQTSGGQFGQFGQRSVLGQNLVSSLFTRRSVLGQNLVSS